jgi:hypothetical protein
VTYDPKRWDGTIHGFFATSANDSARATEVFDAEQGAVIAGMQKFGPLPFRIYFQEQNRKPPRFVRDVPGDPRRKVKVSEVAPSAMEGTAADKRHRLVSGLADALRR